MKDSTAHVQAMIDLVEVIRAAIEASSQFGEENAGGATATACPCLSASPAARMTAWNWS